MPEPGTVSLPIPARAVVRSRMSFFAGGEIKAWQSAAKKMGLTNKQSDVSFVALPDNPSEGQLYLTGGFHPTTRKTEQLGVVHWHLEWLRAPSSNPPADLRKKSDAVGGYPGVLERLKEAWPATSDRRVQVQFSIGFEIEGHVDFPAELQGAANQEILLKGRSLTEQLCFRLWQTQPSFGAVTSFGLTRVAGRTELLAIGETSEIVSGEILEKVEVVAWNGLAMILD